MKKGLVVIILATFGMFLVHRFFNAPPATEQDFRPYMASWAMANCKKTYQCLTNVEEFVVLHYFEDDAIVYVLGIQDPKDPNAKRAIYLRISAENTKDRQVIRDISWDEMLASH